MKSILLSFLLISVSSLQAQTTINFESLLSEPDTFLNGIDGSEGFELEELFFPFEYDFEFNFWSGQWAVSTSTDDETGNASNLYGAINGTGSSGQTYLVGTRPFSGAPLHFKSERPIELVDVKITNTTYAFIVLRDGNQFSKAFGGVDGTDPDEFFLRWKGFLEGQLTDSLDFHLADYRFTDSSQDYILEDWTNCDLSALGVVDSITLDFFSTDVGQFGINTPLFFAMDDLQYISSNQTPSLRFESVNVYPNPSSDFIYWNESLFIDQVTIIHQSGKVINLNSDRNRLAISHLPKGFYRMILKGKKENLQASFIKVE